jgi:1-acyl-sn-glycerol-3-phosphate acyltransferase
MDAATLLTYAEFGLITSGWLPVMAAHRILGRRDPTHRAAGRSLRRMGRLIVAATPLWSFRVEGDLPADAPSRAYVVVANHLSLADPFLLSHLPLDMRFVVKKELMRTPLVGWLISLAGDIAVDRGNRDSADRMHAEAKRTLAAGLSVMIFPEGTRSKTGDLGPFKTGAFRLAIEAGAPILPVAIDGTDACFAPNGAVARGAGRARILDPIETTGLTLADVATLSDLVRRRIAAHRHGPQAEPANAPDVGRATPRPVTAPRSP